MTFSRRRFLHLTTAAAVFAPRVVSAQAYPARAVRVIVPYAPAGPTDVFARLMAQKLSEQLGAQFYVENIAGAGGNIGIGRAAQTTADGYTILVTPHLVGELFRLSIGLDLIHVPFNGGGPAIGSAVAGHTPISFGSMAPAVPLVKDGKLRALAVSSKARSPALPDVPTMAEAGYPEVEGESWFAVVVPAGAPKEIIALLQREIARAIALPEMKERLAALGYEPVASTPEACAAQFRTEIAKWGKVIGEAGIKAQ